MARWLAHQRPRRSRLERLQDVRSERVDERNIRRVPASRDHDPANPRDIVARIESPPRPVEEHLDPGAEIHRIDYGQVEPSLRPVHRPDCEGGAYRPCAILSIGNQVSIGISSLTICRRDRPEQRSKPSRSGSKSAAISPISPDVLPMPQHSGSLRQRPRQCRRDVSPGYPFRPKEKTRAIQL